MSRRYKKLHRRERGSTMLECVTMLSFLCLASLSAIYQMRYATEQTFLAAADAVGDNNQQFSSYDSAGGGTDQTTGNEGDDLEVDDKGDNSQSAE